MVQKKNASVKSTIKAAPKTEINETTTQESKRTVTAVCAAKVATGGKSANSKSKVVQDKATANSDEKFKVSTRKSATRGAASSRAKIAAAAAARRSTSVASSKTEGQSAAKAKSGVKNVAAAVAKSVAKQSTPVDNAKADVAEKNVDLQQPGDEQHTFKTSEYIVYPAHGVGQIIDVEEQEVAGLSLELFVITFEKDKMTLRVPTDKFKTVGMRKLSEPPIVEKAMKTLKGRARIKRTMWSRRAQEYEAKINSGDLVSISEVVRDLYRSDSQPEQSYSERQLYEQALDRMAREIAVVEKLDERGAIQHITEVLAKSAKGRLEAEQNAEAGNQVASDVEAA